MTETLALSNSEYIPNLPTLPLTVRCPSCKAVPGQRCATRLRRGYHLSRADKAVRQDNRTRVTASGDA